MMSAHNPTLNEKELTGRIELIRKYVARPIPTQPWDDAMPALIPFHEGSTPDTYSGGGIIIGSARHAANIQLLKSMNCTAVLNCASGGIARLPVDELKECGIRYAFTNCRRDSYDYPLLHEKRRVSSGNDNSEESYICSQHLQVASELFADMRCQTNVTARQQCTGEEHTTIETKPSPGNILFFCVAGQNRSAALAVATLVLHGKPLEECLKHCAEKRPFVLENIGFQRQLVELEFILRRLKAGGTVIRNHFKSHWAIYEQANNRIVTMQQTKKIRIAEDENGMAKKLTSITDRPIPALSSRSKSEYELLAGTRVEIELLIPGLCTLEVRIPRESTIPELKDCLIQHVNDNLLAHDSRPCRVAKAWCVLAMFGYDDMYDIPLEVEAVELKVQLKRIRSMFGLPTRIINGLPHIEWNEKCRFALVIFSVIRLAAERSVENLTNASDKMIIDVDGDDPALSPEQVPWTFVHEERPSAPSTLLENTLRSTHLRAWDFVTGEALASSVPTVFSFAEDPRDKRAFMMMSKSANTLQRQVIGGTSDILGMGENAIVQRVQLLHTTPDGAHRDENWTRVNIGLENTRRSSAIDDGSGNATKPKSFEEWDAAVKRPFSLAKMLVFLQNSSEAGLAKRLRLANLLNSDKRVLYFYGLGLGLSTNAYNQNEYKFELMLLSKYEEEFSTYTMREFMEEYIAVPSSVETEEKRRVVKKLQSGFTVTSVKVFLVSLLNAFRDLTLMGVQAFDFNHLNNVLVSRDYRQVRLIDIDGNSQGSIDYPAIDFSSETLSPRPNIPPQKPCLDVDLNILLPSVIEQLILGKGRGKSFVTNKRSEVWRANEEHGKKIVEKILIENFYPSFNNGLDVEAKQKVLQHIKKLTEWFYALLKKQPPWNSWTQDVYDAMRCIDHLPIS